MRGRVETRPPFRALTRPDPLKTCLPVQTLRRTFLNALAYPTLTTFSQPGRPFFVLPPRPRTVGIFHPSHSHFPSP